MALDLSSVSLLSLRSLVESPAISTEPELGLSRQPIRFIIVDLPLPEGPTMATNSPRSITRSTPPNAVVI